MNVHDVYDEIRRDKRFSHLRPSKLVPGEGSEQVATAFIIGGAPSAGDVVNGRPFTGDDGSILRQLMELADLHSYFSEGKQYTPNCWLTCVSKYKTAKLDWESILAWRPYLRREWLWVNTPKVIIPVGATAFSAVMGEWRDIEKSAGFPFKRLSLYGWLWIWPMFHPRDGMRFPKIRPAMEAHWKGLGEWLDNN